MPRLTTPLFLLAALALAPFAISAQDAKPDPLPAWEQLSPAQRELLIAPVRDRWNREPDRRPRFMEFAKRWQSMPQPQRERARHGMQRWEGMSPAQRDEARAVFQAVHGMDKDARATFMANWRQMSASQRADWVKAHPAPERREDH